MFRNAVALTLACAPFGAVAQQPEPFDAARTVQVAATIEAIGQNDRKVTLRRSDGSSLVVKAGPDVRTFDEIESGEKVVVIYREGLLAEVKPKGQSRSGARPPTDTAPAPSPPGQRTARAADAPVATTVRIDAVDTTEHTVTFTRADGETRKLAVRRPDAERFIKTLRPGDEVEVTYREAVALSIEPDKG
jgi:hypothetical protein